MILSKWLATLLGGTLAAQGALAIDLTINDEGMALTVLTRALPRLTGPYSVPQERRQNRRHHDDGLLQRPRLRQYPR